MRQFPASTRLLDRDLVIAGIDLYDQLTRGEPVVVLRVNCDDRAVDPRAEWIDMTIDLGVISGFYKTADIPTRGVRLLRLLGPPMQQPVVRTWRLRFA